MVFFKAFLYHVENWDGMVALIFVLVLGRWKWMVQNCLVVMIVAVSN